MSLFTLDDIRSQLRNFDSGRNAYCIVMVDAIEAKCAAEPYYCPAVFAWLNDPAKSTIHFRDEVAAPFREADFVLARKGSIADNMQPYPFDDMWMAIDSAMGRLRQVGTPITEGMARGINGAPDTVEFLWFPHEELRIDRTHDNDSLSDFTDERGRRWAWNLNPQPTVVMSEGDLELEVVKITPVEEKVVEEMVARDEDYMVAPEPKVLTMSDVLFTYQRALCLRARRVRIENAGSVETKIEADQRMEAIAEHDTMETQYLAQVKPLAELDS